MNTLLPMTDTSIPLPVSVLLPTYNCRAYLPAHLEAMRKWTGLVEEIVVVDSFSDDGTMELLKEQLSLPNVRFHNHPRGLYQSWNFGISQISAKYAYISTVGDVITPEGLQHLAAVAEQFQADVTLSPPRFVASNGQIATDAHWPIQDLIQWQNITRPAAVSSIHAFLMSVLSMPQGILGSSASNLYRTGLLKTRPFPTSFGHAGDTAWSLQHALETRFAITPSAVSQFLLHPKESIPDPDQEERLFKSFFDLALAAGRTSDPARLLPVLENLRAEIEELQARQHLYRRRRKNPWWPWIFRVTGWLRRGRRNWQRNKVRRMKAEIRACYGLTPGPSKTSGITRPA
ncbi:MAG: glycosyltransferase family 2 protein [Opitutaceae bacterium]|nr:glycosyltransferase family 2 protein [Verrucomicrobiales bacterium]